MTGQVIAKGWRSGAVFLLLSLAATSCTDEPEPGPDGSDISAEVTLDGSDATVDADAGETSDSDVSETTDGDAEVSDGDVVDPDITDADVVDGDTTEVSDGDITEISDGDVSEVGDGDAGDTDGDVPVPVSCAVAADCVASLEPVGLSEACVIATCNEATSLCEFDYDANNSVACGGGDPCIQAAACSSGFCDVSQPTCDDGDPCTQDLCDAAGTCSVAPLDEGEGCDDSNECTIDDVCDDVGTCGGAPTETCQCQQDSDCDGLPINACTGAWLCSDAYACVPDPAGAIICDDSLDTVCAKNTCNPDTAECAMANLSDGTTCATGDVCIPDAVCTAGACSGPSLPCNDNNPCTIDVCDGTVGGCVYTSDDDGTACDDDNICTVGEVCTAGDCTASTTLDCDDSNECTTDQCEPGQGGCVHGVLTGSPCEDGDPCTVVDLCEAGACAAGGPANCDDGNPCTDDSCDGTTGACLNTPNTAPCSDGDACTTGDVCSGGLCIATPADCDDENPCTVDVCQQQDGAAVCLNQPTSNTPCDDGNSCTSDDFCYEGNCIAGLLDPMCLVCTSQAQCDAYDSANMCQDYVCNMTTNTCEVDQASVVSCTLSETACTENQCDPADGQCKMLPKPEATACDDGEACTENDGCNSFGGCSGSPKACSDGNDCTSDECDGAGVCQHNPLSGSTTYHDEDFNAGIPAGWSTTTDNASITWNATSDEDFEGGGMAMRVTGPDLTYDHGAAEARLDLPPTLLQGNTVRVLFWIKADFAEDTGEFNKCFANKDYASVRVYTSPTSWTSVYCLSNSTNGEWVEVAANLFATSTDVTVSVVFHSNGMLNDAAGVAIDNVRVVSSFECSTGSECTPGLCSAGTCTPLPEDCDDGDACTTDTCDGPSGTCVFTPVANCECSVPADCGFSFNPCITLSCNEGLCQEDEVIGTCDDENLCTLNDACDAGTCTGDLKNCDDGEDCTMDECDPFQGPDGCTHTPATLPCDDGDLCTSNDTCSLAGACSGTPIDCNVAGCLVGSCNGGTGSCEFSDVKHEGSIVWQRDFESDVPNTLPPGWETTLGNFIWEVGFAGAQSAPFSLEIDGPTPAANAGVTTVTLPMLTVPPDGGYLSFYLSLTRTPAYGTSITLTDDVLAILVNGQLFSLINQDVAAWQEQVVELDASLGGQDIEITMEWRNGVASTGYVAVDTMSLRAHAPCDDGDVCTEEDACMAGSCVGSAIPGCP